MQSRTRTALLAAVIALGGASQAYAAPPEPRILIVEAENFADCTFPTSCETLAANFFAGTPQMMAVLVNGIGSLSHATFGIAKPTESLTVHMCNGSNDSSGSNANLSAWIWTPEGECVTTEGAFIRLVNLRITTTWPAELAIVENPVFGVVTVTDCNAKTYDVLEEHRGVAGLSMPSSVPCTDLTPAQEISWSAVKALFGKS